MKTEELLVDRNKTHGSFETNAEISQTLKLVLREHQDGLSLVQVEAVDMICLKLSRIHSGQSDFRDHWDDIAGYAKLAADRCSQ